MTSSSGKNKDLNSDSEYDNFKEDVDSYLPKICKELEAFGGIIGAPKLTLKEANVDRIQYKINANADEKTQIKNFDGILDIIQHNGPPIVRVIMNYKKPCKNLKEDVKNEVELLKEIGNKFENFKNYTIIANITEKNKIKNYEEFTNPANDYHVFMQFGFGNTSDSFYENISYTPERNIKNKETGAKEKIPAYIDVEITLKRLLSHYLSSTNSNDD